MSKCFKICIISNSNLESDPRVLRQLHVLRENNYYIHTIGLSPSYLESVFHKIEVLPNKLYNFLIKIIRAFFSLLNFYFIVERILIMHNYKIIRRLSKIVFDLVIANDIEAMILASRLKSKKILLDCHEYSMGEYEKTFKNRLMRIGISTYLTHKYINQADRCSTVCKSISDKYLADFGRISEIIFNVPDYYDIPPSPVDPDRIRMIHHGGAIRQRQLERMIIAVGRLDEKFELDLMLVPTDMEYYCELQNEVLKYNNVRLIKPVPYSEIITKINEYDVGIYNLNPNNINNEFSLPNKFFEYIQARLAIAVGPSIEMKRIVEENNIGVVSFDFSIDSFTQCISSLTVEKIAFFKNNSDSIANRFSNATVSRELERMIKDMI